MPSTRSATRLRLPMLWQRLGLINEAVVGDETARLCFADGLLFAAARLGFGPRVSADGRPGKRRGPPALLPGMREHAAGCVPNPGVCAVAGEPQRKNGGGWGRAAE